MDEIHVYPQNDLEEHTLLEGFCNCKPTVIERGGKVFYVHNSYDGRECVEMANEILNQDLKK